MTSHSMELRPFGSTGVKISPLALGTMMLGSWGNTDERECIDIVHEALDAGINVIDTADRYGAGDSERIVGRALQTRERDNVIVATKGHGSMGPDANMFGNSRRWILRACEDSLRRLGTDYIDLYQIHRPEPDTHIDETLGALSDLVGAGKVRYIGTSTFQPSSIVEAQWVSERRRRERFVSEQPPYSMLARGVEFDVLPTCQRHDLAVLTWSPLAGGWLSGRWGSRSIPDMTGNRRATRNPGRFDLDRPENQRKLAAVDALAEIAATAGHSLVHLAIAWVLRHPAVTSTIIGPRTIDHLRSQTGAADVVLDDDLLDAVDAVVAPGTNFQLDDGGYVPPWLTDSTDRRRRL